MSPRLRAVAEMVPQCDTFYDIGTDHGLLPAFLLESGHCRRAVLTDISPASLDKAKRLFAKRGLLAEFHVTDGLSGLSPAPGDAIALCGMGAQAMLRILSGGLPCTAVLQPSARVEQLRLGLPALGIAVRTERLAREGRRFYPCLLAEPGDAPAITLRDAHLGTMLRGDPLYPDYLRWKLHVLDRATRGGSPDEGLALRRQWAEEELREVSGG